MALHLSLKLTHQLDLTANELLGSACLSFASEFHPK